MTTPNRPSASRTDATKPEALVVMSRDVFENQFDPERLERLRRLARVPDPVFTDDLDDPALDDRLATVEVLLTGWGAPRLDRARLDRMPRLKAMLHCAGTIRPQVSEEFWLRGIRASTVAEANAVPVAEFTLAAVIFAGKKAPFIAADADARRSNGLRIERYGELSNLGRTVGIVGFSRVGRRVVNLLQQLDDVTCLVSDPYADPLEVQAAGGELVELEDLLPRVDVLSLHAPALPSTNGMIGAAQLAALRDHATLINTARGSLVDTDALIGHLQAGRLYAVLDVTEPEPLPAGSALWELPNTFLTPHIAGSHGNELARMGDCVIDELERFLDGHPFAHAIVASDLNRVA